MQTKISKSTAVICGCILLCIAAASLLQLWTAPPKRAISDEQARKAGYSSSSERTQIFEWEQARYDNKLLSDRDVAEATSMLKGASISSRSEILSTLINLGLRDKPMKSETVSLISEYINDPEWSVRYTMALALRYCSDPRARRLYEGMAHDTNETIRDEVRAVLEDNRVGKR